MIESYLEREAWLYLLAHHRQHPGLKSKQNPHPPVLPLPERQLEFAPPRKWRFDFAWPEDAVAMEIDGLGRADGGESGHRSRTGYLADAEKYEAAIVRGWTVYRVPGPWLVHRGRRVWHPRIAETLAVLLDLESPAPEKRSGGTRVRSESRRGGGARDRGQRQERANYATAL